MFRKFRSPIIFGSAITLLVLLLLAGSFSLVYGGNNQSGMASVGAVNPQGGGDPVPGGPGFVSLSAAAFTPYEANKPVAFYGTNIYNPNATQSYYVAPISLPNGATITKFVVYYVDNNPISDLYAKLIEAPFNSDVGNQVAVFTSSGNYPVYRSGEAIPAETFIIDQQSYSYYIMVTLPSGLESKLSGVRVDYSYPSMLPLVNK